MEGIANPSSTKSGSLHPPLTDEYYPAPQDVNSHGVDNQNLALAYNPQQQSNITAIQEQPTIITTTTPAVGDHYLTISIGLTVVLSILFGTYSLICSVPALIFSIKSYNAYKKGDVNNAVSYGRTALRFNIGALVTWIVAFIIIVFVYLISLMSLFLQS